MPARSARRYVALFAIAVTAFGQIASTALACSALPVMAPAGVAHGAAPADAPCANGHQAPQSARANLCEVHCTDGIAVPSNPDLPPVVLHVLPAIEFPLANLGADGSPAPESIAPVSGAPPLTLQFCRLLI